MRAGVRAYVYLLVCVCVCVCARKHGHMFCAASVTTQQLSPGCGLSEVHTRAGQLSFFSFFLFLNVLQLASGIHFLCVLCLLCTSPFQVSVAKSIISRIFQKPESKSIKVAVDVF